MVSETFIVIFAVQKRRSDKTKFYHELQETARKKIKKQKTKLNTQCEVEVLVGEVENRKEMFFGGLNMGITNAEKAAEWRLVADAVNAVASDG